MFYVKCNIEYLTKLVIEYNKIQTENPYCPSLASLYRKLLRELRLAVYMIPYKYSMLQEEDLSDFLLFMEPKFRAVIRGYKSAVWNFEQYLYKVLVMKIRTFKKQRVVSQQNEASVTLGHVYYENVMNELENFDRLLANREFEYKAGNKDDEGEVLVRHRALREASDSGRCISMPDVSMRGSKNTARLAVSVGKQAESLTVKGSKNTAGQAVSVGKQAESLTVKGSKNTAGQAVSAGKQASKSAVTSGARTITGFWMSDIPRVSTDLGMKSNMKMIAEFGKKLTMRQGSRMDAVSGPLTPPGFGIYAETWKMPSPEAKTGAESTIKRKRGRPPKAKSEGSHRIELEPVFGFSSDAFFSRNTAECEDVLTGSLSDIRVADTGVDGALKRWIRWQNNEHFSTTALVNYICRQQETSLKRMYIYFMSFSTLISESEAERICGLLRYDYRQTAELMEEIKRRCTDFIRKNNEAVEKRNLCYVKSLCLENKIASIQYYNDDFSQKREANKLEKYRKMLEARNAALRVRCFTAPRAVLSDVLNVSLSTVQMACHFSRNILKYCKIREAMCGFEADEEVDSWLEGSGRLYKIESFDEMNLQSGPKYLGLSKSLYRKIATGEWLHEKAGAGDGNARASGGKKTLFRPVEAFCLSERHGF